LNYIGKFNIQVSKTGLKSSLVSVPAVISLLTSPNDQKYETFIKKLQDTIGFVEYDRAKGIATFEYHPNDLDDYLNDQ
jgi:hypothetical protein